MIYLLLLFFGVFGNILALLKLGKNSSKSNFTMLMKCLMANNLIALLGVSAIIMLKRYLPKHLMDTCSYGLCAFWILFGFFGIYSACIAGFISIERYLAICHVLLHRELLTRNLIKNALIGLSFPAAVIAFLPFFDLGKNVYVDEDTQKCICFGDGKTLFDRAYSILILCYETLVCIVIVSFNTLVIKGLLKHMRQKKEIAFRSRLNIVNLTTTATMQEPIEIKFSKLMVALNLLFAINWLPKSIYTVLLLSNLMPRKHWFQMLSDLLSTLPYTLDPYIYVLSGKSLKLVWNTVLCRTSCRRRTSPSNSKSIEGHDNTINCF